MFNLLIKTRKRFFTKKEYLVGLYQVQVVSLKEELNYPKILPLEIQFLLAKDKKYKKILVTLLDNGKAIGVRTIEKTPKRVLKAVNNISTLSQFNTITTWLSDLLTIQKEPIFTKEDLSKAKNKNIDFYEESE